MSFTYSCKDCTDRHVGCHGTCEKYKKESEERDAIRLAEKRQRDIMNFMSAGVVETLDRKAKNRKKRSYYRRG